MSVSAQLKKVWLYSFEQFQTDFSKFFIIDSLYESSNRCIFVYLLIGYQINYQYEFIFFLFYPSLENYYVLRSHMQKTIYEI